MLVKKTNTRKEKLNWVHPKGLVEKTTLRGGMNSRPYGRQLLIICRAGFTLKGI